ncbi:hypothetical protein JNO12_19205 [Erwinia aphidicola]|nr:hypothetical protein [Erwinia aphidicola]
MSISDTLQAKKYASIAEVAAAQAKVYADKLDNAPGYAEDAERFANLAGEYSDSAQSASASASAAQSSSSAIQSAESAAESASQAASAAEQAIQQSIGTTLRGPADEQISQFPAKSARHNTIVSFGDDGDSELLALTGFALLDGNGKVPLSNIPAAAITEVFVASSQAEMLASNAQPGDVVKRTDIGSSFILMSSPATTLSNWILITDDVLAQLAAPGGVSLVNGAVSQAALSSSSGSTLSLSQVATAYGLDYSLGAVWSQGASTSSENWWLYGNKVYKSFSATTLSSSPNFDNFYLLSANGSFTGDSFGMSGSTTSSAKLSNIATVLASARETLTFDNDAIISLSSNFDWSFSYKIREGVNVRVDSDSTATRDLNIVHSKTTIEGLVLGAGVNICINSTSSKLTDVKIINVVFDSGYIYTSGKNRGKRLCIKDCLFTNSSGAVANLISFKDWAYVLIENCRGYNPSNAAIFISPSYSYTCYKVVVKSNTFTSCSLYGIAAGGNSEIGCVNDIKVQDNTIQCRSTTITRAFALQWVSGAVFTGNNISAGIVVAAGACHDILFDGNTSLATLSPRLSKTKLLGLEIYE